SSSRSSSEPASKSVSSPGSWLESPSVPSALSVEVAGVSSLMPPQSHRLRRHACRGLRRKGSLSSVTTRHTGPVGHIDINDISYFLPDGRPLLAGVNLRVGEGAKVALVGPNGVG